MDKMWFYAKRGGEKQGPVSEADLRQMKASGVLLPDDLVWSDGMSDWRPASAVLGMSGGGSPVTPSAAPSPTLGAAPIPPGLGSWMKFSGVMNMISGILACLTCFGIVNGVFLILLGTSLLGANRGLAGIDSVDARLAPFFDKLKTFMVVQGVMWIISLVGMILGLIMMIVYIGVIAAMFGQIMSSASP